MARQNTPLKSALVVVDVQNDFCEGGVLAAQSTSSLIGPLNQVVDSCTVAGMSVFFTRDWHPLDHSSFLSQGGPWPPHCVRNTRGAAFPDRLHVSSDATIVNKGVAKNDDGYSMFGGTNLAETLAALEIGGLAVCGIAAEYCVLESVRDACRRGFRTVVLEDLVRAIEVRPGDLQRALHEMEALGAVLSTSGRWIESNA